MPILIHFEPPLTYGLAVQTPQQHQALLTLMLLLGSVLSFYRMKQNSDLHLPIAVILHCKTTGLGGDFLTRWGSPPRISEDFLYGLWETGPSLITLLPETDPEFPSPSPGGTLGPGI